MNGIYFLVELKKYLSLDCKNESNIMKCDIFFDVSNNIIGERGMLYILV